MDRQELSKLVSKSFPRRLFSKRWVYPAIYLGAAAVIIGLMYVRTQGTSVPATSSGVDTGSTTTSQAVQSASSQTAVAFHWPVAEGTQVKVTLGFFNPKATAAEQAATLVNYDGGYYAHHGLDIQASNQQPFAVMAATSGKVVSVVNDPLKGQTVKVVSSDGYTERYESLSSVKVSQGQTIQAGQELGMSGTCQFEQAAGNHLYFSICKGTTPVDPSTLLPQL
jgi:stage II sporulation protein Q